jgi:hypothetical protein
MAERQRLEIAAEPLADFVARKPKSFGGLYFDQGTGRLLATVLTTPSTSKDDVDAVLTLVPSGLPTSFKITDYSMADLDAGADTLSSLSRKLGVEMVGIDTRTNSLVATIAPGFDVDGPPSEVNVPVAVSVGEGLRPASCWNTCTPWRGGMNIWNASFPLAGNCTWGFYGSRGAAAKYAITAGHCGKIGHVLRIKDPANNTVIFTDGIDQNTYDLSGGSSQSDALTAHVKGNANATTPFNTIIASPTDLNHPITSVHSNNQAVGGAVCFFGYASHSLGCGHITLIGIKEDTTRPDDGKPLHITNLVEMSVPGAGGDSGGPVFQGASAYGINYAVDNLRGATWSTAWPPTFS